MYWALILLFLIETYNTSGALRRTGIFPCGRRGARREMYGVFQIQISTHPARFVHRDRKRASGWECGAGVLRFHVICTQLMSLNNVPPFVQVACCFLHANIQRKNLRSTAGCGAAGVNQAFTEANYRAQLARRDDVKDHTQHVCKRTRFDASLVYF